MPIALGAAIYLYYLCQHVCASRFKPTLEMMEAMPGVVMGFHCRVYYLPPGWNETWLVP